MGEGDLALRVFLSGVAGVFTVMVVLQVAVTLSSKLALWMIEARANKQKPVKSVE